MMIGVSIPVATCRFASATGAEEFLCHCAGVAESVVSSAVNLGSVSSVEEVMEITGAGTGCRACHCRIQRVLSGLPAKCGGRFDLCHQCGCIGAICRCEAA